MTIKNWYFLPLINKLFIWLAQKTFKVDNNKVVKIDGRVNKTVVNLFKNNKSRKLTYMSNIRVIKKPNFLIPNAKKTFNHLWLIFIKVLILPYFN